ncbi:MAG: UDP-N-acetylmuramoyl-L-alanyl-D-glutamate--2,6-diaminopimelate ligase [Pseudomonadota bacterium]|nr:UDP-N-acetylmuramoyl-L-alanyl-D-glutamate--2,6-diaminopimelate ligase [Pseudomonadota bacterium]
MTKEYSSNPIKILGLSDVDITGLTADSRSVKPGYLFAVFDTGGVSIGSYIGDAMGRGASSVLISFAGYKKYISYFQSSITVIISDSPRPLYAFFASCFYGKQPQTIIAVTGTNGKSSVVEFIRQMWVGSGIAGASLGTLGMVGQNIIRPTKLTTPDASDLHQYLSELVEDGVSHLALEASSHGLDQGRLAGVKVSSAAFTNFTHDHLDYHGSANQYFDAKRRLFSEILSSKGVAILNADEKVYEKLQALLLDRGVEVLSYGRAGKELKIHDVEAKTDGQLLDITVFGTRYSILLPLIGYFQVMNVLCALGVASVSDVNIDGVIKSLPNLSGVSGRLELVGKTLAGSSIYVDYAHTPAALESALLALRSCRPNKLHLVFGCGGDRDSAKRNKMGMIAQKGADKVFVTDDNPRTENASHIRRQILSSCNLAIEVPERRDAIHEAIKSLAYGDILLIAGKGHEVGQIVGSEVKEFSDTEVAQQILKDRFRNEACK